MCPNHQSRRPCPPVLAGSVDLTFSSPEDVSTLTPTQRSQQLHQPRLPITEIVVLNPRRPPFDNVTARRAAAYAFTADPAVKRILGIPPACTLPPRDFPGYTPGCAFRRSLATAKRLVISSGTAGQPVAVYALKVQPFINLGRETRHVLSTIGYRASLHLTMNYPVYRDTGRRPVNVELFRWGPDFWAASQFYEPLVGCRTGVFARLTGCNRAIDALAHHALRLQLTAPSAAEQAWERVYHRVGADARVIPRGRVIGYPALLSRRTGNYSPNALTYSAPLLDQLWVK
jgi:hypothetical protein